MANFKSKDLTISIPEPGNTIAHPTTIHPTTTVTTTIGTACTCTHITNPCLGFTHLTFTTSPHTCFNFTMCHGYSPIISPGTCTTSFHCTPSACGGTIETTVIPNISDVTDAETLSALKEKLSAALKEVEAQHAAISKK